MKSKIKSNMSVKAKNKRSGVESTFTEKQWAEMQKNPYWIGKFVEIKDLTPKEVKEMDANRKVQAVKGTTEAVPEVAKTATSNAQQSIETKK